MTHRFFVAAGQLEAGEVCFTPEQVRQMRHVLRLGRGDVVRVFDGRMETDRVVRLTSPERGQIIDQAPHARDPRTRLIVYPALLPRDRFESVLQKLTELGVAAIGPMITQRGLVRAAPDEQRLTRWGAIVREAAEQCGRGSLPVILPTAPTLDTAVAGAEGRPILAHAGEGGCPLNSSLNGQPRAVSVFVGPEGGFSPDEVERAHTLGARVVGLGPRTLRADTASPVLAALVLYELADL
jgi:16S rRNA (uracil1498-N3)-methyltransferase